MKKETLKLLLCSIFLIFCWNANLHAQEKNELGSKKMQKDFKDLKNIIEAHPDPFTHISEKDFNHKFDSVKLTLATPSTTLEFYKKAAFIVALIKDGHSSVNLPKDWMEKLRKKHGGFPFEMHLTNGDDLHVLKSFQKEGMPKGAKILKINGVEVDSFLRKIDPFVSYELKRFRNTIIDNDFEKYLYLAFGFSENTEFEYSHTDTTVFKTKNIPFKEWKKFKIDDREEREIRMKKGKPYSYKKVKNGIGLISIYAFSAADMDYYEVFLKKTFKEIQNDSIKSLIIDVRGNYGGWPKIASKLFHYISEGHFKTLARAKTKVSYAYKNYFFDRIPSLKSNRPNIPTRKHYLDLMGIIGNKPGTFLDEEEFFNEKPITREYEFKGDCYLLTNRDSYSAASSFASTFQCYQMGTIIGEETGGTKIFRANAMYDELYRSGLRVGMSTTKLFTTCYLDEMEGITPTVEYSPSIFELTSDLDTHLFFALRVIKEVKAMKQAE